MTPNWQACKNILCIRADNMGDVIMSGPAIRALKSTFNTKITLLTSSMGAVITGSMNEPDELIIYDFPWVKTANTSDLLSFNRLVEDIRSRNFDAAIIFSVYSQNPMPAILLAYLAGIPRRLAYCRENPYHLLTDWVPDEEPYTFIRHQVRRDLDLVASVGAYAQNENLQLKINPDLWDAILSKLILLGFDPAKKWMVVHAGVSERKRQFPFDLWVETARKLVYEQGYQLIFTGSGSEKKLTNELQQQTGVQSFSTAGLFSVNELITLISRSPLLLSVNTGTVHIAAAVNTPLVILYALTNPQHTPWKTPSIVIPYQIPETMHSKNEVVRYVNRFFYNEPVSMPDADHILKAIKDLIDAPDNFLGKELCLIELMQEQIGLL